MINIKSTTLLFYGLVCLAIISRVVPHPVNFTPFAALGLFTGAYLTRRFSWLIPVLALLISDLFIGFYHPMAMVFVYLGFGASIILGYFLLRRKRTTGVIFATAIVSSAVFFLISNFGVWLSGQIYPMTLAGLKTCYIMAIPFYGNTLLGALLYSIILFGVYEAGKEWLSSTWNTAHQD